MFAIKNIRKSTKLTPRVSFDRSVLIICGTIMMEKSIVAVHPSACAKSI